MSEYGSVYGCLLRRNKYGSISAMLNQDIFYSKSIFIIKLSSNGQNGQNGKNKSNRVIIDVTT